MLKLSQWSWRKIFKVWLTLESWSQMVKNSYQSWRLILRKRQRDAYITMPWCPDGNQLLNHYPWLIASHGQSASHDGTMVLETERLADCAVQSEAVNYVLIDVLNCESENCSIRCTVKPVAQRSLHLHSSWVNWHQDLGLLWTMWEQVRLNLPIGGDTCLFVEVLVPVEDILLNPQQHNTLCTVLSPHACCIWQVTTDSIVQKSCCDEAKLMAVE